ncbi:MAG TPA: CAP domain-containing protein [Candidatus Acidoferrales bacterium]|nr:CAP domain-containing protein [Candidatus Acidoferrales bacterium]
MSRSRIGRAASLSAAFAVFVFALIALPQNPSASHANAGMRAARSVSPQKNSAPSANANANSAAPAAQERAISPDARALFEAANRERTARGLRPFVWDDSLAAAAAHHAQLMAERKTLEHQLPGEPALQERANAAGARFSRVAENIAVGQDVEEIQSSWMHSPGHRANILAPELTAIGVAVAPGAGRLWAVEDFSRQVPNLTLDEQEKRVGGLIAEFGLRLSENQREARRACESGVDPRFGGSMAVVRFETGDLSKLPENVGNAIKRYHYSAAAVGACKATTEDSFARYKIAVLLF